MDLLPLARRIGPALAAVVLAGCSAGAGPQLLLEFEPPAGGAPVADDVLHEAAALENPQAGSRSIFLFPFWFGAEETTFHDDRLSDLDFGFLNLGLTWFPLLPLYVDVDRHEYAAGGVAQRSRATWTPLWAWTSETDWDASNGAIRFSGVPLVYGRAQVDAGSASGGRFQIDLHHFLWSAGPMWLSGSGTKPPADEGGAPRRIFDGWFFAPLSLFGVGPLLWTSTEVEGDSNFLRAHGPGSGLLGFYSRARRLGPGPAPDLRDEGQALTERTRLLLGGILWSWFADLDADGHEVNARHGPLWGIFGWGKRYGEDTILLFWFPIEV